MQKISQKCKKTLSNRKIKAEIKEKGITLVALIITIIVLLILAGITISAVIGNKGILNNAKNASTIYTNAEAKEKAALILQEYEMKKASAEAEGKTPESEGDFLKEKENSGDINGYKTNDDGTPSEITIGGITVPIINGTPSEPQKANNGNNSGSGSGSNSGSTSGGNSSSSGEYASNTTKYSDGTNIAMIPAGFTVSGFDGEKTINSGLVIYKGNLTGANWTTGKDKSGNDIKRTYNQYVWIPCNESDYKRTEWRVEEDYGSKAFNDEVTLAGVTLSDYDKGNGITTEILNEIVNQITKEKASIKKYGGFYMGRYEVGEGNVISQYKEPSASLMWSEAYTNAKSIDVGSASVSYLSSSYARDTALNFIQNNSEFKTYASSRDNGSNGTDINENWQDKSVTYIDADGASQTKAAGTATATRLSTGVTTAKCNIYDMGGNVTEFTTELNPLTNGDNDATVVLRGGCYCGAVWGTSPAGSRWDNSSEHASDDYGFRATLFIK